MRTMIERALRGDALGVRLESLFEHLRQQGLHQGTEQATEQRQLAAEADAPLNLGGVAVRWPNWAVIVANLSSA